MSDSPVSKEKRTLFKKLFGRGGNAEHNKASTSSHDDTGEAYVVSVSPVTKEESVFGGNTPVERVCDNPSNAVESNEIVPSDTTDVKTEAESTPPPSNNPKNRDSVNMAVGAAAVFAGVTLATPRPANAWVGDIVDGITEKAGAAVLGPLKSLFGNLMEGFGLSNMFSTQEGAKTQGRSTDAINEVNQAVENSKIMRATEPPPHLCLNIQEKIHLVNTYKKQQLRTNQEQSRYYQDIVDYGTGQKSFQVYQRILQGIENNNSDAEIARALLKTSPIIQGTQETLTTETRDNAVLSVDSMIAPVADRIGKPNLKATGGYAVAQAKKISLHNRLSIARNVLVKEIEEKVAPNPGEASRHESRKRMVDRTFGGGSDWFNEVLGKGDMVPLIKDELVLAGTTNALLLDILDSSKDTNKLLATMVVSSIDKEVS